MDVLFAGVATADLDAALPWYEALMGRPADILVHEGEVMWRVTDGGWLYLVLDPPRSGHALVAIAVPDLERALAEVVARGLTRPAIEVVGQGARKATLLDPEANTVALIEVPASGD
jgi:predicted enzyme related to lactoylglutathione lyase